MLTVFNFLVLYLLILQSPPIPQKKRNWETASFKQIIDFMTVSGRLERSLLGKARLSLFSPEYLYNFVPAEATHDLQTLS